MGAPTLKDYFGAKSLLCVERRLQINAGHTREYVACLHSFNYRAVQRAPSEPLTQLGPSFRRRGLPHKVRRQRRQKIDMAFLGKTEPHRSALRDIGIKPNLMPECM